MMMQAIRPAAVAGMFYPADAGELAGEIRSLLSGVNTRSVSTQSDMVLPKALIVPHAGYIYSGPIAASAYRLLEPLRNKVKRVLIFGPSHRVAFSGLALPTWDAFATPLGNIEVDRQAADVAKTLPGVRLDDRPQALEHSLEVQLPFLQSVLDDFRILPVAIGMVSAQRVAECMHALWGEEETLIVVSSDLSHYNPYKLAVATDRATIDLVLEMQPLLGPEQACGCTAINALLLAAPRHHLSPRLLDLRNSGDTAGDRGRVVGYAAVAFASQTNYVH